MYNLKRKKVFAVMMALVMTMTMMFATTTNAFASADEPSVTVSVTYGNFNPTGNYTGNGFPNLNLTPTIDNYEVAVSTVDDYISYFDLKSVYLPANVTDPMNGEASVLDAIIAAVWDNFSNETGNGDPTVVGGWDSWTTPNGGYISNILNYPLTANATTYFKGENGNKWGRSTGTGWNIAYKYENGNMTVPAIYASNISLEDGMEIVFDVSPYDMTWDTGVAWTE
mgnify:CR=1 FL=1